PAVYPTVWINRSPIRLLCLTTSPAIATISLVLHYPFDSCTPPSPSHPALSDLLTVLSTAPPALSAWLALSLLAPSLARTLASLLSSRLPPPALRSRGASL
ncbi:hypothetical protein, partial [Clavibacter michiganensis]|uniref:hypothetical protein n=1 Tax=Clavibacter michiganensis TaxID=28447 RepID=UPI00374D913C